MSLRKVCFIMSALCALLLCAGCAAQEPLFFVTDDAVYALPPDGEPQLVYECTGGETARGFCLVDHTPYLMDGEALYRVERNLTVTRLFDLEGADDDSMRQARDGFRSSRHFAVTVKDGVVTAYYQDHMNEGGAVPFERMGEATQTVVARSSDGTVRRYDVPMQPQSGFAVTDTAILTTQICVSAPEERKRLRVYVGLYQTDLATGETQLLQKMRKIYDREIYDGDSEYVMMTGEAAMYVTQPDQLGNLQIHYLWGSTGHTLRPIRGKHAALHCRYGDVDAFSDGADWIRLYQAGSDRIRPYQAGRQIAIIERSGDEAWAEDADKAFVMTADGGNVAVSVMAEEGFCVYVADRETGMVTRRLKVPAAPGK